MARLRTSLDRIVGLLIALAVVAAGASEGAAARQQQPGGSSPDTLAARDWAAIRSLLPPGQQSYLKASQVSPSDAFGVSVAVSGDTVVVGAMYEDSGMAGVQNSATPSVNESASGAGAAYVFVRSGAAWSQQAYLKASQVSPDDTFGVSVAIDGDTIVVGAPDEDGGAAGVQNSATPSVNESASGAGAAYVFARSGAAWSQQAYLKASQVSEEDFFGRGVGLDGDTIVVGAFYEDSGTAGVQNSAAPTVDEALFDSGAAFVFARSGATWSQQAYLKASQVSEEDFFGQYVAVSGDTIVVGSYGEDGSAAGVQNTAAPTVDESADSAGAAFVFVRSGATWSQQAYLKASQVSESDWFGLPVAVSGDTIVVGATFEDSGTAGVQTGPAPTVDESASNAGAAYVFARSGATWSQQAYLKASQVSPTDQFGRGVALAGDTIVIGAISEDSSTPGVQNSAAPTVNESASNAGAAYVYAGMALPPTETPTNTPEPPTDTPTATATDTPTNTPTATDTPTDTPTNTATDTPVPPTDTPTNTAPATATNTSEPPTDTPTATAAPLRRLALPLLGSGSPAARRTDHGWLASLLREMRRAARGRAP